MFALPWELTKPMLPQILTTNWSLSKRGLHLKVISSSPSYIINTENIGTLDNPIDRYTENLNRLLKEKLKGTVENDPELLNSDGP